MKRIPTLAISAAIAFSASAARHEIQSWPDGAFSAINVEKTDTRLIVTLDINADAFHLKANREVQITPIITDGRDTLPLHSVTIAGRTRYFQHRRARDIQAPEVLLREDTCRYSAITDYQDWMQSGSLKLLGVTDGCCGAPIAELPPLDLASFSYEPDITPDFPLNAEMIYVAPTRKEDVKTRSMSGKAYIDFPVNQIGIYPDYRRNPEELAAIQTTIDEIRGDKDVNITSISFKGYASPEGPYDNNERLAKGRTEALKTYVKALYSYPESVMHVDWEAEDWEGLRTRLLDLDIPNRDAINRIITDPYLSYDEKDLKIKTDFPQQYAYLLREVYPALRHSDYMVEFTVRNFFDVTEIAEVYAANPSKLSHEELFVLAQTFDDDTPEYRDVIMTAVSLFPDDPEANLNATAVAIDAGDIDKAEQYIAKAGDSPEAIYTAGIIAAERKDFDLALELLTKAEQLGVAQAPYLVRKITKMKNKITK